MFPFLSFFLFVDATVRGETGEGVPRSRRREKNLALREEERKDLNPHVPSPFP